MQVKQGERRLLFVAIGVLVFALLALISLIYGVNQLIFYAFAIVTIALGFYLAVNLSKSQPQSQGSKK